MIGKRQKRKFANKVRTGCITCRRRRVKCDESKPSCHRCVKLEVDCEGYGIGSVPSLCHVTPSAPVLESAFLAENSSELTANFSKFKKLAPRTYSVSKAAPPLWIASRRTRTDTQVQLQLQPKSQRTGIIRQPPFMWIEDEREGLYIRQFQEQTASHLAGYFRDPLLRTGIFQACCLSAHIRNAVVGLAALDRSSREVRGSPDAYRHYELAVAKFIDGIRGMRQLPESLEPLEDPRLFLIFCLLTFCFEAWNGSSVSAVSQVRSGWHHARRWLDDRSSCPDAMDCELTQLFHRLENSTVVSVGIKRDISSGIFRSRWMISIDDEMPPTFDTVETARMWHEMLVRSMLHSVLESHKLKLAHANASKGRSLPSATAETHVSSYMAKLRLDMVAKFEQWHTAFEPLLQQSQDSPTYAAAIALELRYVASSKPLAGTIGLSEGAFDTYHPEFASAIQLASRLIAYEKSHYHESKNIATFTIDGSIVPSLYVVSIKCRDRRIRRQAVQLLLDNPRREGLWDSALTAKIGLLSMSIEEDGALDDGSIPVYSRIVGVRAFSSMLERGGTMSYTKTTLDEDMKPVLAEHSIEFSW